jgi:hypothetical protein
VSDESWKDTDFCVYSYLKEKNLLEFEKYMNSTPESRDFDCKTRIAEFLEYHNGFVMANLEQDESFKPHIGCLMEHLKSFDIEDFYLLRQFYVSSRSMSIIRQEKAVGETNSIIVKKIEIAQELCVPELMFGYQFDKLYEDYNRTEDEGEDEDLAQLQENYCQVEHLLAWDKFDKEKFWFNSNPENITVTDLDCNAIWHSLTDEDNYALKHKFEVAFGSSSPKELRCIINTIQKSDYSERLAAVWTFRDIRLSDQRFNIERKAFIIFMKKLYASVMKCRK